MDIKSVGSYVNSNAITKAYSQAPTEHQSVKETKPAITDKIEISPEARKLQTSDLNSAQNTKYTERLNSGYYNSKQVASIIAEKMLVELMKA